jgi:hypothetical protein
LGGPLANFFGSAPCAIVCGAGPASHLRGAGGEGWAGPSPLDGCSSAALHATYEDVFAMHDLFATHRNGTIPLGTDLDPAAYRLQDYVHAGWARRPCRLQAVGA